MSDSALLALRKMRLTEHECQELANNYKAARQPLIDLLAKVMSCAIPVAIVKKDGNVWAETHYDAKTEALIVSVKREIERLSCHYQRKYEEGML